MRLEEQAKLEEMNRLVFLATGIATSLEESINKLRAGFESHADFKELKGKIQRMHTEAVALSQAINDRLDEG